MARGLMSAGAKLVVGFFGILILGASLLFLAYQLPTEPMLENVSRSLVTFQSEGLWPNELRNNPSGQIDNATDALMLNMAIFDGGNDLAAVMSSRYGWHEDAGDLGTISLLEGVVGGGAPMLNMLATGMGT